ncbi:IS91 family transposase [Neorhizobium galegae]|uniref:IS91 family transposase n=1 Tax=Neorhizobium galegae TaxID=399 RepID=UPI0006218E6C|nr:Transposase [Neorhizobium galegae bv. orientalis]
MRTSIEVADIFRAAGPNYRKVNTGHLSLSQLKVMSAVEHCRTAALGGHVEACEDCGEWRIAYNSCRNRPARSARALLHAHGLPNGRPISCLSDTYVVFTLPAEVAAIAFHNKALVYDLLFKAASETMLTIAADPKHLGARIGITAVLHTWGSAMTHHPHVHMIVPGGGIALDGSHWISSRPAFLLPVRVLGKLFRRLFLTRLLQFHDAGGSPSSVRLRLFSFALNAMPDSVILAIPRRVPEDVPGAIPAWFYSSEAASELAISEETQGVTDIWRRVTQPMAERAGLDGDWRFDG